MGEEETVLEFACSECGRKVTRDSYTFYASMVAPDETRKCPECGHVPDTRFYYCSPECFEKGVKRHGIHRPYYVFWGLHKVPEWWPYGLDIKKKIKIAIEKIMASEGLDREAAENMYWKRMGYVQVGGTWKRREFSFHKEFPLLAKKLGFMVYKQGWPDFLIEKDEKYIGVEVKEFGAVLADNQRLMHEALRRAGLKVIVVTPDTDLNRLFMR